MWRAQKKDRNTFQTHLKSTCFKFSTISYLSAPFMHFDLLIFSHLCCEFLQQNWYPHMVPKIWLKAEKLKSNFLLRIKKKGKKTCIGKSSFHNFLCYFWKLRSWQIGFELNLLQRRFHIKSKSPFRRLDFLPKKNISHFEFLYFVQGTLGS